MIIKSLIHFNFKNRKPVDIRTPLPNQLFENICPALCAKIKANLFIVLIAIAYSDVDSGEGLVHAGQVHEGPRAHRAEGPAVQHRHQAVRPQPHVCQVCKTFFLDNCFLKYNKQHISFYHLPFYSS